MKTVNMHEAKTHLSRLIEEAEKGQPFIIARAGKPAVQVTAIDVAPPRRLGFLQGQFAVPTVWDRNIPLPDHKAES